MKLVEVERKGGISDPSVLWVSEKLPFQKSNIFLILTLNGLFVKNNNKTKPFLKIERFRPNGRYQQH